MGLGLAGRGRRLSGDGLHTCQPPVDGQCLMKPPSLPVSSGEANRLAGSGYSRVGSRSYKITSKAYEIAHGLATPA
jgi:hypothetical protein